MLPPPPNPLFPHPFIPCMRCRVCMQTNQTILRDLSHLQIQMRDYAGFKVSRTRATERGIRLHTRVCLFVFVCVCLCVCVFVCFVCVCGCLYALLCA